MLNEQKQSLPWQGHIELYTFRRKENSKDIRKMCD